MLRLYCMNVIRLNTAIYLPRQELIPISDIASAVQLNRVVIYIPVLSFVAGLSCAVLHTPRGPRGRAAERRNPFGAYVLRRGPSASSALRAVSQRQSCVANKSICITAPASGLLPLHSGATNLVEATCQCIEARLLERAPGALCSALVAVSANMTPHAPSAVGSSQRRHHVMSPPPPPSSSSSLSSAEPITATATSP